MPLIGRIRDEALSTLAEAKMIKAEQGPVHVRKLVEKITKKAAKVDKSELARMSTYDIFFTFVYLINSDNSTYEETLNYCEEIKSLSSSGKSASFLLGTSCPVFINETTIIENLFGARF